MAQDPNFIVLQNYRTTRPDWKAIIGPGGGQKYWSEGHPLVETLFDYGVSSLLSLDLKLRYVRTPDQAARDIINELEELLTPTAPNKLVITGYSTGGMILFKAFHDAGDRLQKLLHEDSVFTMIGVSLRFQNPAIERFIHLFWTTESSKNDPIRLAFLKRNHGDDWPAVVTNCGKWMERYSGLFLEVDEVQSLCEQYPNIFFITGDKDSNEDNTPFFTKIESATKMFTIPNMGHFSYFSKENWPITRSVYLLVLQLHNTEQAKL